MNLLYLPAKSNNKTYNQTFVSLMRLTDDVIEGLGRVFPPSEMPRSFLVKRGGLYAQRSTARSRCPEPTPLALDLSGDGKVSRDASLKHSCPTTSTTVSQQEVQAASCSAESGSPLQRTHNSTLNLFYYLSLAMCFLR